jgi:hypothetical protein
MQKEINKPSIPILALLLAVPFRLLDIIVVLGLGTRAQDAFVVKLSQPGPLEQFAAPEARQHHPRHPLAFCLVKTWNAG